MKLIVYSWIICSLIVFFIYDSGVRNVFWVFIFKVGNLVWGVESVVLEIVGSII